MKHSISDFCAEVCSYVNHATDKEKRDIEAELTAHLLDHRDAMVSQGLSQDDAEAHALAAMGDPAEIGRELNKEYPLLWLIVSRVAAILTAVFLLMSCMALSARVDHVYHNLQARWAPMSVGLGEGYENVQELDLRFNLKNGDIMKVYGVTTTPGMKNDWAYVFCCFYDNNIFSDIANSYYFDVYLESSISPRSTADGRGFGTSAAYAACEIAIAEDEEELLLHFERGEQNISCTIPLTTGGDAS